MKLSSSRLDMEGARLERPNMKNYAETVVGGSSGTATTVNHTVDLSLGNVHHLLLSVAVTNLNFFYLPVVRDVCKSFTLILRQDTTGSRTVVWPVSVNWAGNTVPTLLTNAGSVDSFSFFTVDSGASWHGNMSLSDNKRLRTLWAFGENNKYQLGDSTSTISRSSPIQVGALTDWASIAHGIYHTIATKTDGTLWAFGGGASGRLGNGTTIDKSSPVQIGALTDWASVAGGRYHSLATKTDGTLWSFGQNSNGQLGDNTTVDKSSPVQVGALTSWASVAAGQGFSLATKIDGTLWSFGYNGQGRLGDGSTTNKSSPVQVGALTSWASVAASWDHGLAIKTDGTLWGFGKNSSFGQLGDGTAIDKSSPVQIGSLVNWASVACGFYHSLATKTDGTLWSFGRNDVGQLGDDTTVNKSSPVQVGSLTNWSSNIAAGQFVSLAIKTDGTLWSFGSNGNGQLGDNTAVNKSSPVQVGSLTSWVSISSGGRLGRALRRG